MGDSPGALIFVTWAARAAPEIEAYAVTQKNSTKARRLRFHEEVAQDILRSLDSEDAIFGKVQPDVDHMMLEVVAAPLFSEASLEEKVSTPTSITSQAESSTDSWA